MFFRVHGEFRVWGFGVLGFWGLGFGLKICLCVRVCFCVCWSSGSGFRVGRLVPIIPISAIVETP